MECAITQTTGSPNSFNDTELKNIFGGFSISHYIQGDFYYFAFHYETLEVSEMHSLPASNS